MAEWKEGDSATYSKTITEADILLFSAVSGDNNPVHLDAEYAKKSRFGKRIAHGMLASGLISAVIGNKIPGPGALYVSQLLRFLNPVFIGDTVTVTATISVYEREKGRMILDTLCRNQDGEAIISGEAEILYRP